jgi:hypothetical protein
MYKNLNAYNNYYLVFTLVVLVFIDYVSTYFKDYCSFIATLTRFKLTGIENYTLCLNVRVVFVLQIRHTFRFIDVALNEELYR